MLFDPDRGNSPTGSSTSTPAPTSAPNATSTGNPNASGHGKGLRRIAGVGAFVLAGLAGASALGFGPQAAPPNQAPTPTPNPQNPSGQQGDGIFDNILEFISEVFDNVEDAINPKYQDYIDTRYASDADKEQLLMDILRDGNFQAHEEQQETPGGEVETLDEEKIKKLVNHLITDLNADDTKKPLLDKVFGNLNFDRADNPDHLKGIEIFILDDDGKPRLLEAMEAKQDWEGMAEVLHAVDSDRVYGVNDFLAHLKIGEALEEQNVAKFNALYADVDVGGTIEHGFGFDIDSNEPNHVRDKILLDQPLPAETIEWLEGLDRNNPDNEHLLDFFEQWKEASARPEQGTNVQVSHYMQTMKASIISDIGDLITGNGDPDDLKQRIMETQEKLENEAKEQAQNIADARNNGIPVGESTAPLNIFVGNADFIGVDVTGIDFSHITAGPDVKFFSVHEFEDYFDPLNGGNDAANIQQAADRVVEEFDNIDLDTLLNASPSVREEAYGQMSIAAGIILLAVGTPAIDLDQDQVDKYTSAINKFSDIRETLDKPRFNLLEANISHGYWHSDGQSGLTKLVDSQGQRLAGDLPEGMRLDAFEFDRAYEGQVNIGLLIFGENTPATHDTHQFHNNQRAYFEQQGLLAPVAPGESKTFDERVEEARQSAIDTSQAIADAEEDKRASDAHRAEVASIPKADIANLFTDPATLEPRSYDEAVAAMPLDDVKIWVEFHPVEAAELQRDAALTGDEGLFGLLTAAGASQAYIKHNIENTTFQSFNCSFIDDGIKSLIISDDGQVAGRVNFDSTITVTTPEGEATAHISDANRLIVNGDGEVEGVKRGTDVYALNDIDIDSGKVKDGAAPIAKVNFSDQAVDVNAVDFNNPEEDEILGTKATKVAGIAETTPVVINWYLDEKAALGETDKLQDGLDARSTYLPGADENPFHSLGRVTISGDLTGTDYSGVIVEPGSHARFTNALIEFDDRGEIAVDSSGNIITLIDTDTFENWHPSVQDRYLDNMTFELPWLDMVGEVQHALATGEDNPPALQVIAHLNDLAGAAGQTINLPANINLSPLDLEGHGATFSNFGAASAGHLIDANLISVEDISQFNPELLNAVINIFEDRAIGAALAGNFEAWDVHVDRVNALNGIDELNLDHRIDIRGIHFSQPFDGDLSIVVAGYNERNVNTQFNGGLTDEARQSAIDANNTSVTELDTFKITATVDGPDGSGPGDDVTEPSNVISIESEAAEDLKRILDRSNPDRQDWNGAIADFRETNPEATLVLGSFDLEDKDLSGFDFAGIDMTGVNLNDSDLSDADLRGANISGARLDDTNFRNAQAQGLVAISTDFSDANELNDADLTGADLTRSTLPERMDKAELAGATLYLTTFDGDDPRLRGANLEGAIIGGGDSARQATDWTDSIDVEDANFKNADLRNTDITISNGENADFSGIDGSVNTSIIGTDDKAFDGAKFHNADLENARVSGNFNEGSGADFKGANLKNVDFDRSEFGEFTNFENAEIERAKFTQADGLEDVDFSTVSSVGSVDEDGRAVDIPNMRGVNFTGSNLTEVFLVADLTGANFTQTNLADSKISGTLVGGTVVNSIQASAGTQQVPLGMVLEVAEDNDIEDPQPLIDNVNIFDPNPSQSNNIENTNTTNTVTTGDVSTNTETTPEATEVNTSFVGNVVGKIHNVVHYGDEALLSAGDYYLDNIDYLVKVMQTEGPPPGLVDDLTNHIQENNDLTRIVNQQANVMFDANEGVDYGGQQHVKVSDLPVYEDILDAAVYQLQDVADAELEHPGQTTTGDLELMIKTGSGGFAAFALAHSVVDEDRPDSVGSHNFTYQDWLNISQDNWTSQEIKDDLWDRHGERLILEAMQNVRNQLDAGDMDLYDVLLAMSLRTERAGPDLSAENARADFVDATQVINPLGGGHPGYQPISVDPNDMDTQISESVESFVLDMPVEVQSWVAMVANGSFSRDAGFAHSV